MGLMSKTNNGYDICGYGFNNYKQNSKDQKSHESDNQLAMTMHMSVIPFLVLMILSQL